MTSGVRIAVIAGALHPACCAPRDASFGETPSAALNVTAALRRCGDSHASGRMELPLSSEDFVCAAQCHESEPGLHEAFEPWWDHKLHPHVFREFCDRVAENDINHRRVAPLFVVTFSSYITIASSPSAAPMTVRASGCWTGSPTATPARHLTRSSCKSWCCCRN